MMHAETTPGQKSTGQSAMKHSKQLAFEWILRLAKFFRVYDLESEAIQDYVNNLCGIRPAVLHVEFVKCQQMWNKPRDMPPLAFILDIIARYQERVELELKSAVELGDTQAKELLEQLIAKSAKR